MQRVLAFVSLVALLSCATPPREQSLVNRAAEAIGGDNWAAVKTVTVKGTTKQWEPEQSDMPGGDMRFANEASFATTNDMEKRATRTDFEKKFAYPTPRTFKYSEVLTSEGGFVLGVDSNGRNAQSQQMNPPAHSMSGLRLATSRREGGRNAIGTLIRNMQANPDQIRPAADLVVGGRALPAVGYGPYIVAFDPQTGLPERVRTLDYDNVLGDVTYDLVFSDWRDAGGGAKLPFKRHYELNGRKIAETEYSEARLNAPMDAARFEVPAALRADAAKPASGNVPYQWVIRRQFIGTYMDSDNPSYDARGSQGLRFEQLASGVYHVVGGTHNSLVVEMSDHLVVVDAPVNDAHSLWVMNQAKQRFPGKPVRWVVLTHHHMDHAGGVRALLTDGATLVVGRPAAAHFRRVLSAPMSRNPDLQPYDFNRTPILEVPESHVIADAQGRQVIAYLMDNPHAKGMLMAWVPHAKLGFVTDVWNPGQPLPDKLNAGQMSVVNTVKRAGIEPERFAGGHGSTADYASLVKLAGQ